MKSLCLLFFFATLVTSHTSVRAQSFYRPGFIIVSQGDTLRGLVGFRENKKSFETCLFKESEEVAAKSFLPTDILAYGYVNDKIFESRFIETVSDDSAKVFLQVLARGRINLYTHVNNFYVEKEHKKLLPLSILRKDNKKTVSSYHINLMRALTIECPELGSNIKKILLAKRSLTEVVEKYNRCVSPSTAIPLKISKPWIHVTQGILIGIGSSTLSFEEAHVSKEFLTKTDFTHRPSLNLGAFLLVSSPRTSERFSLHIEATYNQDSYKGFAEIPGPYTATSRNYTTVDFSLAKAATLLRYSYPNSSSFLPYLSGGITNNFVLKGTTTRRLEVDHGSGVVRESKEEAFTPPNHFFGLTSVLGTTYALRGKQRFMFEMKYDYGYKIHNKDRGLLRNAHTRSASHNLALIIGYFL